MTTHYTTTEQGGMQFSSTRRPGDVRIPNYVYDLWMPLLGADVIGVYGTYCRLERAGTVKAITQKRLAREMRIGAAKLAKTNALLARCGFISINKPQGTERLMHWTTEIVIHDPPQTVDAELIEELAHPAGYEVLCPWLAAEPTPASQGTETDTPEAPNGSPEVTPSGVAKIAPSVLHPLGIKSVSPDDDLDALLGRPPLSSTMAARPPLENAPEGTGNLAADWFTLAETVQRNQDAHGGAWTTPEAARDAWTVPARTFCAIAGRDYDGLATSEAESWPREFERWAADRKKPATPQEAEAAIRAIKESEHHWRTFATPFEQGLHSILNAMLDRARTGQPLNTKKGGPVATVKPGQARAVEAAFKS